MDWITQAARLAEQQQNFVMVTLVSVRGHAPRGAGTKMIVSEDGLYGTVGGGNLEQTAVERARALLTTPQTTPELLTLTLNPKGGEHGVQCCGGEVTVLLEPTVTQRPTVAIFGAGHVGFAIARILVTLPWQVTLVDSREAQFSAERFAALQGQAGRLRLEPTPIPETALADLPAGSAVLILTHDHAEDIAIVERALRRDDLAYIGLIGSSAKWSHFRSELAKEGLTDDDFARVTTPIGLPEVPGKTPEAIAIAVAAQLVGGLEPS